MANHHDQAGDVCCKGDFCTVTQAIGRCDDDGILSDIHNSLIPGQEGTSEYMGCVREGKQERPL